MIRRALVYCAACLLIAVATLAASILISLGFILMVGGTP